MNWAPIWESVVDPALAYPASDRASCHGYDAGHLSWEAAFEFEVALRSRAVHSSIHPEAGAHSDRALRDGYQKALLAALPHAPATNHDLHCIVGLGCFALRRGFPGIAAWHHAMSEATGLSSG